MKKSLRLTILTFAILTLGCSGDADRTIHIIYSGGIAGYLEPCGCREGRIGGMARLAGAIRDSLQQWNHSILLLDAGEFAESYGSDLIAKNRTLLKSLALMNYDAVNVTTRDLMAGIQNLQWAADSLGVPLISANLKSRESGQRLFPGWIIKEIQGRRIGVIGVGAIRPLERMKAEAPSLEFTVPESAIREALEQIRNQCDWVILICDLSSRSSRDLAARISGLDFVISTSEIISKDQARKFGAAYVIGTSRKGKQITTLSLLEAGDSLKVGLSKAMLDSTVRADEQIGKLVESHRQTGLFQQRP
ncbi:MAG TPA: hypothetical protein VF398_07000 [bacterium]